MEKNFFSTEDMDILDDMGVSKLSAKVFFKSEPLTLMKNKATRDSLYNGIHCI